MSGDQSASYRRYPPYVARLGLKCAPFARDEAFFFPFEGFDQRLEMALRMIEGEGTILINGEHNAGKSTLLNHLVACDDGSWQVCHIEGDPMVDAALLVRRLQECFCSDPSGAGIQQGLAQLGEAFRLARDRSERAIILLDNAHLVTRQAVELLLDLCTWRDAEGPLARVILFAEPQIKSVINSLPTDLLDRLAMHQIHLVPFRQEQTSNYIEHKLRLAGLSGASPFSSEELEQIHHGAQGLPGRIDRLAHRTLLDHALRQHGENAITKPRLSRTGQSTLGHWLNVSITAIVLGTIFGLLLPLFDEPALLNPPEPATESADNLFNDSRATTNVILSMPGQPAHENRTMGGSANTAAPQLPAISGDTTLQAATDTGSGESAARSDRPSTAAAAVAVAVAIPQLAKDEEAESNRETTAPTTEKSTAPPAAKHLNEAPNKKPPSHPLLELPPENYTIQIFSGAESGQAVALIASAKLPDRVHFATLRYPDGSPKETLFYGNYRLNREAKEAINRLPESIRTLSPWTRNLSDVQREIRASYSDRSASRQ